MMPAQTQPQQDSAQQDPAPRARSTVDVARDERRTEPATTFPKRRTTRSPRLSAPRDRRRAGVAGR
jgi:hypothetical protein